jgi:hypothetical protein
MPQMCDNSCFKLVKVNSERSGEREHRIQSACFFGLRRARGSILSRQTGEVTDSQSVAHWTEVPSFNSIQILVILRHFLIHARAVTAGLVRLGAHYEMV